MVRTTIRPVFVNRKPIEDLKAHEANSFIINRQSVLYRFKYSLCDAGYVDTEPFTTVSRAG